MLSPIQLSRATLGRNQNGRKGGSLFLFHAPALWSVCFSCGNAGMRDRTFIKRREVSKTELLF